MQPRSVLAKTVYDHRRGALWWAVGIAFFVAVEVGIYPSVRDQTAIEEMWRDMPDAMRALFGLSEEFDFTSGVGFLEGELFSFMLPLVLIAFAVALGGRAIGREEDTGTLDLLLAHPVRRRRVVLEKFAAGSSIVAAVGATTFAAIAIGSVVADMGVGIVNLGAAMFGVTTIALLYGAIALLVSCAIGKRGASYALASAAALAGFLVNSLASLTDVIAVLRPASPFRWAVGEHPLRTGFSPWMLVTLAAIAIVVWMAATLFERRDVGT